MFHVRRRRLLPGGATPTSPATPGEEPFPPGTPSRLPGISTRARLTPGGKNTPWTTGCRGRGMTLEALPALPKVLGALGTTKLWSHQNRPRRDTWTSPQMGTSSWISRCHKGLARKMWVLTASFPGGKRRWLLRRMGISRNLFSRRKREDLPYPFPSVPRRGRCACLEVELGAPFPPLEAPVKVPWR